MSAAEENPAFPRSEPQSDGSVKHYFGMSLRDWFAGQAMLGIERYGAWPASHWAQRSYEIADAMLIERAKEQP
jgi:hypothetical protein